MKFNTFWQSKLTRKPEDETGAGEPAGNETPPADGAPADPPPAETTTETGPDLSFFGDDFMADGQLDTAKVQERWEAMVAEEARRAEEAPDIPEDGNYDLTIPDGLDLGEIQLPEGVKIEGMDPEDEAFAPVFEEAKAFFAENKIGQTAAKGLMGLMAKAEAAKEAKRYAAAEEAYKTLGATDAARSARMSSLQRAVQSRLPGDLGEALLTNMTQSPDAVRALERLLGMNAGAKAPQSTPPAAERDPLAVRYPNSVAQ